MSGKLDDDDDDDDDWIYTTGGNNNNTEKTYTELRPTKVSRLVKW